MQTAFVGKTPWTGGTWALPLHYLSFTWLAGHALLYVFAHAAAVPRRAARLYLTRRVWSDRMAQMLAGDKGVSVARLRELFDKYDTSSDGRIDATEFKVALRALTGADVALSDCEATIRAFDTDGSGHVDFSEFCDAIFGAQSAALRREAPPTPPADKDEAAGRKKKRRKKKGRPPKEKAT